MRNMFESTILIHFGKTGKNKMGRDSNVTQHLLNQHLCRINISRLCHIITQLFLFDIMMDQIVAQYIRNRIKYCDRMYRPIVLFPFISHPKSELNVINN